MSVWQLAPPLWQVASHAPIFIFISLFDFSILDRASKDMIRFDRCARCFCVCSSCQKQRGGRGWSFWGLHAVVVESIVIQASWDAVWDQAHAESVQKINKHGWKRRRYLSRKIQYEKRIFMEKWLAAANWALVDSICRTWASCWDRSVFLKNWPCVTFFAIQFGQFLRTNISLVCLHVNRQLVGRSTRRIFPGNFYVSLVRAYNFMNCIPIIYPSISCPRKFLFSCNRSFSEGKNKNLVPLNNWKLQKI